ncbi:theronine dehydrogenase [Clohesyomyces aquaticus]|uniref:Theronine dehydrogenase n=1 Tax=Clohesyomyces aquaticus TaxID=1231657 RepID=A0A1Y1ZVW3_9PLEO|nr:theronine dehydrogenase [Clohesyomyces aquaticus]
MKALTYQGPGNPPKLVGVEKPEIQRPTDAIVKLKYTTICGTDLHILKGDVPTIPSGLILGHEGVGTISSTGPGISSFSPGDPVLISCISSCGTCTYCKRGMYSHCTTGGWALGNKINGTQAEYVRIPNAENSLYKMPPGIDQEGLVMLSDIFPTGLECGVLNADVKPGSTVAIIGAGPVGLAALITAQLYSPSVIVMVDPDANRLEVAKSLGATHTATPDKAVEVVKQVTEDVGCDAVLEVVGVPETFAQCQDLVAPGGRLRMWAITTRLVDTTTTPMLLKLLAARKLPADKLITHRFKFADMEKAYETFGKAGQEKALKVLIEMS